MTKGSAEYFAKVAGEWDSLRGGYFGEEVRTAAIAKAYLRPEMVVADVGAGTGFVAAGLAPVVRQVHVIDGSAAMLDVARGNLNGLNNVVYHLADGQSLPLPDGSLDAVFANMYLHHCPDPLVAIREMVRVLRPGGRLVLTDLYAHNNAWLREEMADVWLGFERAQVRAWLREAGLANLVVDGTGQSCCAESTGEVDAGQRTARISVFVATGTRRVPGAREAVQAGYAAVAQTGITRVADAEAAAATRGCCGPAPDAEARPRRLNWSDGRSEQELAEVPQEAAEMSLSCGNPTAMASLRAGESVLDIGSGAGIDVFYAARKVGPTGRVIGLDMTPAMIERAQRTAVRAGLPQVEFRLGQAEAMPVEDGSIDVILSNCVINLCEDKGQVFAEAYRVLKAGGRLSISDVVTEGPLPVSVRSDAQRWAGCVHGALPESEYLDLLAQAGFQDVRTARSSEVGEIEGVRVYSLAVSARKGSGAAGGCERSV
jgi:ubiquinone/menaquinone biosynthesis C-methylase UbiE